MISTNADTWLFSTVDSLRGRPARTLVAHRIRTKIWPLGGRTPFRGALKPGDRAVLYIGGNHEGRLTFAAEVAITSATHRLSDAESNCLAEEDQTAGYWYGVGIAEPQVFIAPVPIKQLAGELSYLPRLGPRWGAFVRQSVRLLTEHDYTRIRELADG